jgi:hypothetical protein
VWQSTMTRGPSWRCWLSLIAAHGTRAHTNSQYWRASAQLDGRELTCELSTTSDGRLELLPETAYGRGSGQWHCGDSGVIEGRLQLYLYTIDAQPSDVTEVDLLCVCASPTELRGLLFALERDGRRLQIGAAVTAPDVPNLTCPSLTCPV